MYEGVLAARWRHATVQDLTEAIVIDVHQVWLRTPLGPRNQGPDVRQEAGGINGPSASSPFLTGPTVELMRKHTLDSSPNYVPLLNCSQANMVRTVRRTYTSFLHWLIMRCKLRPELASEAQQTAWSKTWGQVKSIYLNHPWQGSSTAVSFRGHHLNPGGGCDSPSPPPPPPLPPPNRLLTQWLTSYLFSREQVTLRLITPRKKP